MNIPRQMIEAGAIGIANSQWYDWGNLPEASTFEVDRRDFMEHATAAIRAAIGCAEVVMHNDADVCRFIYSHGTQSDPLAEVRNGDTILIVRAEKGGGNG